MKILRSILAVLSAPVFYGVLCVPLVSFLMGRNPELLNDSGGTYDVGLTIQAEVAQAIALLIIGFLVAAIAPGRVLVHVSIAVVLMLGIGISVQLSFWDSMLVWHHFVFFGLIVGGLYLGALAGMKILPSRSKD